MSFYTPPRPARERARAAAAQLVQRGLNSLTSDEIAKVIAEAILSKHDTASAQAIADLVSREIWIGAR